MQPPPATSREDDRAAADTRAAGAPAEPVGVTRSGGDLAASAGRAPVLDALRGFAVLGILLANMQHFSGWFFLPDSGRAALPHGEASRAVEFAIAWFIDGKFYSLFSLLFGIGFAVMLERATSAGDDFGGYYRRRLRILLVIGLLHGWLIWFGDILTLYALLGFTLIRLNRRDDDAILQWALLLFMVPSLQYVFMYAAFGGPVGTGSDPERDAFLTGIVRTFSTGSWIDTTRLNIGGVLVGRYPDLLFTGRPFKVLATFLLGLWLGRRRVWELRPEHRHLLRRAAIWGLLAGVPLNYALAVLMATGQYHRLEPLGLAHSFVYSIGVPALALGYAASFALLWRMPAMQRLLAIFAPAGRMALTNYIAHSVIGTAIFYGWGGGRFGRMDLATATLIALGIFAAQLVVSALWLRACRYGPLEWVWRSLTLRRAQPFLRRTPAAAASRTPR